jgi:hypothetical protein
MRRATTFPQQNQQQNQENQVNPVFQVNQEIQEIHGDRENHETRETQESQESQESQTNVVMTAVRHAADSFTVHESEADQKANTHSPPPPSPASSSVGGLGNVKVHANDPSRVGVAGSDIPIETHFLSSDTIDRDQTNLLEIAKRDMHISPSVINLATSATTPGEKTKAITSNDVPSGTVDVNVERCAPSLVGKPVPPPSPRKEDRLPDPPVVLEKICQSVPPFDIVLFRRSTAAQRYTRELLIEAARLARPQVKFNWRILSNLFPELKSVEILAKIAEAHKCGHLPREDVLVALTTLLTQNLDAAGR